MNKRTLITDLVIAQLQHQRDFLTGLAVTAVSGLPFNPSDFSDNECVELTVKHLKSAQTFRGLHVREGLVKILAHASILDMRIDFLKQIDMGD
jgi:hypothetical protein